jgi:glycosyltransferase involved in cell wall biosynthesis
MHDSTRDSSLVQDKSRMRCAFIVDKCFPFFKGGYEDRYYNLAKRLALHHDVRMFTSLDQAEATIEGVRYVRATLPPARRSRPHDRTLLHSAAYALQLTRRPFGDWSPDVVIVEAIPFLHLRALAGWLGRERALVVLNVNEAWSSYHYARGALAVPSGAAIRYLLRRGLDFSDVVVTISNSTAHTLRCDFHVEDPVVVPMGLDHERIMTAQALESDSRPIDFVCVGRAVSIKRQGDFLLALSRLKSLYHWSGRAAIVGDGPLSSDLERKSVALGLDSNVEFLRGLDDSQKFKVLQQSRVFVLCSEREGFSLSTLEAQASGAIVVAARPASADVFGVSDLISDGETGLLYPAGNINSLEAQLQRVLSDPLLRRRLAGAALVHAEGYDWDPIVAKFESTLLSIIDHRE